MTRLDWIVALGIMGALALGAWEKLPEAERLAIFEVHTGAPAHPASTGQTCNR